MCALGDAGHEGTKAPLRGARHRARDAVTATRTVVGRAAPPRPCTAAQGFRLCNAHRHQPRSVSITGQAFASTPRHDAACLHSPCKPQHRACLPCCRPRTCLPPTGPCRQQLPPPLQWSQGNNKMFARTLLRRPSPSPAICMLCRTSDAHLHLRNGCPASLSRSAATRNRAIAYMPHSFHLPGDQRAGCLTAMRVLPLCASARNRVSMERLPQGCDRLCTAEREVALTAPRTPCCT